MVDLRQAATFAEPSVSSTRIPDRRPFSYPFFVVCTRKVRDVMTCRAAPPTVGFRGQLLRRHEALSPWSLTRTVTSLHRRGMSWTAVYWFLWGLTQPLYCVECG